MLRILRQRLASCALALVVCHTALVFAAPLTSCCPSRHRAAAIEAEPDCCPAGSHAPGQCPRHAGTNAQSRGDRSGGATCRMECDAPHGAQFLLGGFGLLPAPAAAVAAPIASRPIVFSTVTLATQPFVPDAPPPRA